MEIGPGKEARRCRCRAPDAQANLMAAARIPRRYEKSSLRNHQRSS